MSQDLPYDNNLSKQPLKKRRINSNNSNMNILTLTPTLKKIIQQNREAANKRYQIYKQKREKQKLATSNNPKTIELSAEMRAKIKLNKEIYMEFQKVFEAV